MLPRLRVGIVGLGTAGQAAALFLSRAGHQVHVYERVESPGPVGAGIVLQPTGMAALEELGLRDRVVARGAPLLGLSVRNASGRRVLDLDYAHLAHDLYGVGLHRGALFQAMQQALDALPVTVETGVEIHRVERTGALTHVFDADGARRGSHDLVIVADGARSIVAAAAFSKRRQRAYPWGALWVVAEDRERAFTGRLQQVVRGADRMIGLLPTGVGPVHDAPSSERTGAVPLVSLYYSVRGDRVASLRRDFGGFRAEVEHLMPESRPVLEQIADESKLLYTSYQDVRLFPWHGEGIVAIGDAGHAMSPQLGQGANLALWDAMVLAKCMSDAEHLDVALTNYSRRRRAHLRWFQLATRYLTPLFQGDSRLLGTLRDAFFPWMARIPQVRRLMVASMAGNTCGPLRRSLELPSRPAPLLPSHAHPAKLPGVEDGASNSVAVAGAARVLQVDGPSHECSSDEDSVRPATTSR